VSAPALCGLKLCIAASVSGVPHLLLTRNTSATPARVIESWTRRTRSSPLTTASSRPTPNTTSMSVAKGFSLRRRTTSQPIRSPATPVAASNAGQSATPATCSA